MPNSHQLINHEKLLETDYTTKTKCPSCHCTTPFFVYKNPFYENVEAVINQNIKNVLRTGRNLESIKNVFVLLTLNESIN